MKYVSKRQILMLHESAILNSGGSNGIRDEGMLESAIAAPMQSYAGISNYPTIEEKAARLGFGIISNHPFVDGNKRTGAHVMLVVLYINGIELEYEQQELIDIILDIASGREEYQDLYDWIMKHKMMK